MNKELIPQGVRIPAHRKLYCKRGMTDILIGKGEYLLKDQGRLFLAENNNLKEATLITIGYKDLLRGWKPGGYSLKKLWLISFVLKEEELSLSTGRLVGDLLAQLTIRGIDFRVSRPLPPCIFKNSGDAIKKYRIPLNCSDCLELFIVSRDGKDNLICNRQKSNYFLFYRNGRYQLVELLKNTAGISRLKKCRICQKKKKCKFWLWQINCCNYRKDIISKFGNDSNNLENCWKDPWVQWLIVPWWLYQDKWEVNTDIRIWQEIFKDRLKDEWIIDIGGAHGRNSFGLCGISKKIVLLDFCFDFFKYTLRHQKQKKVYFPILNADASQLPFKTDSIGMIYSGGILHCMPREEKIRHLRECLRVLKPGGLLIGMVMAEWEVGSPVGLWFVKYKKEIVSLCEDSGFSSVRINAKVRMKGEPQQFWLFTAAKSLPRNKQTKLFCQSSAENNYSLRVPYWVTPVYYEKRILCLYDVLAHDCYVPNKLSPWLWNLLERQDIKALQVYLRKMPKTERRNTEEEFKKLIKKRYLFLGKPESDL